MILTAVAFLSFAACAQGADNFMSMLSNGHKALKLSGTKSSNTWLMFPDQKEYHQKKLSTREIGITRENIVHHDDIFWKNHGADLGLNPNSDMRLSQATKTSVGTTSKKYDQYIGGVRVFGGDFRVTVGSHGGVLHVHGKPLELDMDLSTYSIDTIRHHATNEETILNSVKSHLTSRPYAHLSISEVRLTSPMELVWDAIRGSPSLAYHVTGVALVSGPTTTATASVTAIVFDAFVNPITGEVQWFIDKSGAVVESPFASPIDDAAIYVHDQYLKDYNDDFIMDDDYYNPVGYNMNGC